MVSAILSITNTFRKYAWTTSNYLSSRI